jgi:peptide/nickel transport system substrate-binding protein
MRTISKRMSSLLISILCAGLVLAACSSSGGNGEGSGTANNAQTTSTGQTGGGSRQADTNGPQYGGTLTIAVTQDPIVLGHPPRIIGGSEQLIARTALETLGRYNEKGELEPYLAESWEWDVDNAAIYIKLREGVQFHDGTPLDAEALRWNLELMRQAEKYVFNTKDTHPIEIVDERTVKVPMVEWDYSIFREIAYTTHIISPTAYEKNGGADWAADNPVGTGPFKFVEWDKSVGVKFVKNENYWQEGTPYVDAVEWKIVSDSMTAESMLRSGEVDIYYGTGAQTVHSLASQFQVLILENGIRAAGRYLAPDSANPDSPFADVRVREAITYAINRQPIVDAIFLGYATPISQYAFPGGSGYNPDIPMEYNPEKAKRLLAEAGYPNGFKTQIIFENTNEHMQVFTAVQGDLKAIGIDAELVPITNSLRSEIQGRNGTWEGMTVCALSFAEINHQGMLRQFSSQAQSCRYTIQPPEVDELLAKAKQARSNEERSRITAELNGIIFGTYHLGIPIYLTPVMSLADPKVHDSGMNKYDGTGWWPEQVWIAK